MMASTIVYNHVLYVLVEHHSFTGHHLQEVHAQGLHYVTADDWMYLT